MATNRSLAKQLQAVSAALLVASGTCAFGAACYRNGTIKCCIISSPAPNLSRQCSGGNCPDVIISDPNLDWVKTATEPPAWDDWDPSGSCECTWEKYKCGLFGISCTTTGTNGSGTATGSVKSGSACFQSGPPA